MTHTKKVCIAVLTIACIVCSMLSSAFASELQPRYTTLTSTSVQLEISTLGRSTCTAEFETRSSSYNIELDLILYRVDSNGMTEVKSWDYTDTLSISVGATYYVPTGNTYQLVANVVVTNSAGTVLESVSVASELCSC